jgi:hypothetical protein
MEYSESELMEMLGEVNTFNDLALQYFQIYQNKKKNPLFE